MMTSSVGVQYAANVACGHIERDEGQLAVIEKMMRLEKQIADYRQSKSSELRLTVREPGACAVVDQGPLYLRRSRTRQDDADGFIFPKAARLNENAVRIFMNS